jgi:hypothetical protein
MKDLEINECDLVKTAVALVAAGLGTSIKDKGEMS